MTRPLVLLDVDGVLNAVPLRGRSRAWDDWKTGHAVAEGNRFPILWSPSVIAAVLSWREVAEVQWLTTWGYDANRSLRHLVGLPELPVAGTYDAPPGAGQPDAGAAHAAVAPAAPDPLTGRWWKYDVVARLVQQDPRQRLIWVDDDLDRAYGVFARWADAQQAVTAVVPDPRCGLTPEDLEAIAALL